MSDCPQFSDGFAEPILWGVKAGYSLVELVIGLEIHEAIVKAVVESRSGVRFPRFAGRVPLIAPAKIDPTRTDAAYLAWARSQRGATQLLRATG